LYSIVKWATYLAIHHSYLCFRSNTSNQYTWESVVELFLFSLNSIRVGSRLPNGMCEVHVRAVGHRCTVTPFLMEVISSYLAIQKEIQFLITKNTPSRHSPFRSICTVSSVLDT
jgi:hypothetical protein